MSGGAAAGGARQADQAPSGGDQQPGRRQRGDADAANAPRLDRDAAGAARPVRARRRAAFFAFTVAAPSIEARAYKIEAVATAGGREYREGYDVIRHRDLETRYLYRPASVGVKGTDVTIAPGLRVGYVMGVGDDVPSGIAQLGVEVQLLGAQDLASADLGGFNAIVTGTRAYAVREDLRTYNRRLLDYVKNGGNLIVLYNTPPEFAPSRYAPFPGELPRNAEEVSEEDSPVEILAPDAAVFTTPKGSPRPISTGGSSSADRNSGPPGTAPTRRCCRRGTRDSRHKKVGGCTPGTGRGTTRISHTRSTASFPTA